MSSKSNMIRKTLEQLAYLDKDCYFLTASLEPTTITDSKIGGVPYIPKGESVPVASSGQHLRMIAQINLEQLDGDIFPISSGILQFWGMDEEFYGTCFDEPCKNDTSRVVFYENIGESLSEDEVLASCPDILLPAKIAFPVGVNACKLTAVKGKSPLSSCDYIFDELFMRAYKKLYPDQPEKHFWQIDDPEEVFFSISTLGHKLMGYPDFTQTDPRDMNNFSEYTLLLQLDTDMVCNPETGETAEILWGDFGIGNWFIAPCDLKYKDFSKVMFNWDCG